MRIYFTILCRYRLFVSLSDGAKLELSYWISFPLYNVITFRATKSQMSVAIAEHDLDVDSTEIDYSLDTIIMVRIILNFIEYKT